MKGFKYINFRVIAFVVILGFLTTQNSFAQIISQYVETDSGTSPKGLEIWNNTSVAIDFSVDNLIIEKGTNGGAPSSDFTIDSGVLQPGEVLVVGTIDMQPVATSNGVLFYEKAFTFNGDDALVLKLGTTTTDVFGSPNTDPGSAWEGNGVSTQNQNIALLSSITTGELTGFTDPSTRFETINTTPSDIANGGLDGFGVAPSGTPPPSTCSISDIGLGSISCNDNGTPSDGSDDIISFELDPTGSNLGTTYTVEMTDNIAGTEISTNLAGPFSSFTATGTYGTATTFYLAPGSAGSGDLNISVTDGVDATCSATGIVTDPGSCLFVVSAIFEDFNDGDFTSNPVWTGNTAGFSVITDASIPNGNATTTTDGSYLASNANTGNISLAVQSSEVSEWQFSLATPDFNPSGSNYFGVVLMASDLFSGDITASNFQGYYIKIGINSSPDPIELWRKTGAGQTKVGDFPSSPDFNTGALKDGLNIRITRSDVGEFELFYSTGFEYSTTPTTSAGTVTDNNYSTSNYFGVFQNFGSQSISRRVYLDNIDLGSAFVDSDSKINAPTTQVASGTITADVATSVSNSVPVFKFEIEDLATSDTEVTEVTKLRLVPGANNTASWSQVIQGISINSSGAGGVLAQTNQSVSISDTGIIVDILDNTGTEMTVPNGVAQEYTINVFLKDSGITDQEVIQFAIPSSSINWQTAAGSSQFAPSFTPIEGNTFTIDVNGIQYSFISQPTNANVNLGMPTDVKIAYVDNNNNIDLTYASFTSDVSITSSGTLQGTTLTATPIGNVVTFDGSSIIHTVVENNVTLTATSTAAGFPANLVSNAFDIISAPELLITEIADPSDIAEAKYVEIFNAGVTAIDFSSSDFFLTREANAGNNYEINQLTGVLPPKGYYIISNQSSTEFSSTYNGATTDIDAIALGNGNDTYILSTSGANPTEAINTQFDVYGEIGINGFTGTNSGLSENTDGTANDEPWEYEDSRAYRLNPDVKFANTIWTSSEWVVDPDGANTTDMTPGYGDQDYVYVDDTSGWTSIGLGNPEGNSTGSQNIFVRSGEATFSSDITVGDLVVRSGATLILSPNVKLTVTGDIVNEGKIIFQSDSSGSAVLEPVVANTRIEGSGFETHRFIPKSNRAYRYLSPSVSTDTSTQPTIRDNWQEGVNNTSQSDADNLNPNPGFGTHITGSTTGANGFDATSTGNASMYEWNINTQSWNAIPNTDTKPFFAGEAYAIMIRGDRATTLNSNTAVGDPTTLRTTGKMHFGDFVVSNLSSTSEDFNLIGNPYQSQVDLKDLLDNHASGINNSSAYIYDPTLGTIGGYATIDLENLSFSSVPAGTSANQYLQPNQAFFVKTTAASPSITFEESVKQNSTAQVGTFSESQSTLPSHLNIDLINEDDQVIDGVRIVYDNTYSSTVNQKDAVKAWNFNESLTIYSEQYYLSIEKRGLPIASDTTQLQIYSYTKNDYSLNLDFQSNGSLNVDVFLLDQYTQSITQVMPDQITTYNFSVDQNIPESISAQRFEIIYSETTLGLNSFDTGVYKVYPNPITSNIFSISADNLSLIDEVNGLQLFSLQGQLIDEFSKNDFITGEGQIKIRLDNKYSDGLYVFKVFTENEIFTLKAIISQQN
jgi:hypothetical protein